MSVDNYDIVTILGNSIDSPMYEVKHKETHETYIWHTIDWENKNEEEINQLDEKINKRVNLNHVHLLKFHGIIRQEVSKICYVMTECCENLKRVIERCIKNDMFLCEELICKILYQIAIFIKTADVFFYQSTLENVFLDNNFTVKLYNFSFDDELEEPKLSCLGILFYELCTLQKFYNDNYKTKLQNINSIYSTSLISLITQMINDNEDVKKSINKILCHPVILLKSSQWNKDKCFENYIPDLKCKDKDINSITIGIGKLKSKEFALRIKEQKLDKWEQELKHKAKEISILENTVKEKFQKAELYLKRCRKIKSVETENNQPPLSTKLIENKTAKEELNATYVSIDTVIPTSKKLNVHEIVKPAPFTRTLSEKRIRFKGHSPLKDIDFNKKRTIKPGKQNRKSNCWITCSEETDRSSVDSTLKRTKAKLFQKPEIAYSNNDVQETESCQPIVWTEQNKKQAFQLLRIMNSNNKENKLVKHTYL